MFPGMTRTQKVRKAQGIGVAGALEMSDDELKAADSAVRESRGLAIARQAIADRGIRPGAYVVYDGATRQGPFRVRKIHKRELKVALDGRSGRISPGMLIAIPPEHPEPDVSGRNVTVDGKTYEVEYGHHVSTREHAKCHVCYVKPAYAHLVLSIVNIRDDDGTEVDPDTPLGKMIRNQLQTDLRQFEYCQECGEKHDQTLIEEGYKP